MHVTVYDRDHCTVHYTEHIQPVYVYGKGSSALVSIKILPIQNGRHDCAENRQKTLTFERSFLRKIREFKTL